MPSSRRGFLGQLAASIAAGVLPVKVEAEPATPVAETPALSTDPTSWRYVRFASVPVGENADGTPKVEWCRQYSNDKVHWFTHRGGGQVNWRSINR